MVEIWLVEPYYRDYQSRKGRLFFEEEKVELFQITQELQENWPSCAVEASIPPEVGTQAGLYYVKCNFRSGAHFRIAFAYEAEHHRLIALTCRTKEELARGASNGTVAWHRHMATVGRARLADVRRGFIAAWKIY